MADTYTPVLPLEFRSGNEITVERATITRDRMVEILAAAIEAYQRQQWISVDDRLPDPETDVLVKHASKFGSLGFDVAGMFRGEWMSQATEDVCRWPVSHWMPLPPAPTEAQQ